MSFHPRPANPNLLSPGLRAHTRLSTGSSSGSSVTLTNDSNVDALRTRKDKEPLLSPSPNGHFQWIRGELIGKGSYGRVYMAMNATTGEVIAVKQVEFVGPKEDSRQQLVMKALRSESDTLKDLDHPNIVQYLGFEASPQYLSIFLEYIPGGSIGSCLLNHGRFDEEVTKSFMFQILTGLEYLHSKGILHRDLKADNILVEPTGLVKISDFGVSKKADDMNAGRVFTAMQGTVFWMAPEILSSHKHGYTTSVDIWSLGCTLVEMLTAQRPFFPDEVVPVMLKLYQFKSPPPIPKEIKISPEGHDFRQQCFAPNPDNRPTAQTLRRHPYLKQRPGWTFSLSDIEKPLDTTAPLSHNVRSRKKKRRWVDKDLPPIPSLLNEDNKSNEGPPIVFITPSRPATPSGKSMSIPLAPVHTQRSMLVVANPDDEGYHSLPPKSRTRSNINLPTLSAAVLPLKPRSRLNSAKPIPHHAETSPNLNRDTNESVKYLLPGVSHGLTKARSMENLKTGGNTSPSQKNSEFMPRSGMQSYFSTGGRHQRNRSELDSNSSMLEDNWVLEIIQHLSSAKQAEIDADSDQATTGETSSDEEFSSSMWQKRPVATAPKLPIAQDVVPPLVSRRKPSQKTARPVSWAPRPFIEDVVSRLEEFFPNYDLDKPLIEAPATSGRMQSKKSIRYVAKESIARARSDPSNLKRKTTKVWGSRMHKIAEVRTDSRTG